MSLETQLNDGRVYDFKIWRNVNDKVRKIIAEAFCEKSPALESLLLSLWSQGIDTIACCGGHEDPHEAHSHATQNNVPYITIIVRNIPVQDLISLISRISEEFNDDVTINCTNHPNQKELLVSFEFRGAVKDWSKINETREGFFKMLQKEMSCIKTVEIESDDDYKAEIVKGLIQKRSYTVHLVRSSESIVRFTAHALDKNGYIYTELPMDSIQKVLPNASKIIEELNNGGRPIIELTPSSEDE